MAKKKDNPGDIKLVSRYSQARVILKPSENVYTPDGNRRLVAPAVSLRFTGSQATAPAELRELIEDHPAYKVDFWIQGDPSARPVGNSLQVTSGQQTTASASALAATPPSDTWDDDGVATIRPLIAAGSIDLKQAMLWELTHKNRKMVIEAISKQQRESGDGSGDESEDDGEE